MHTEPASRSSASQVLEAHGRAAPHLSSPLATPCLSSVFMPSLTPLLCYFFPLSGLITPLLSCNVFSCVSFLVGLVPPRLLCSPSPEASLLPPLGTPIPSTPPATPPCSSSHLLSLSHTCPPRPSPSHLSVTPSLLSAALPLLSKQPLTSTFRTHFTCTYSSVHTCLTFTYLGEDKEAAVQSSRPLCRARRD